MQEKDVTYCGITFFVRSSNMTGETQVKCIQTLWSTLSFFCFVLEVHFWGQWAKIRCWKKWGQASRNENCITGIFLPTSGSSLKNKKTRHRHPFFNKWVKGRHFSCDDYILSKLNISVMAWNLFRPGLLQGCYYTNSSETSVKSR